jgi:hypothetical protein
MSIALNVRPVAPYPSTTCRAATEPRRSERSRIAHRDRLSWWRPSCPWHRHALNVGSSRTSACKYEGGRVLPVCALSKLPISRSSVKTLSGVVSTGSFVDVASRRTWRADFRFHKHRRVCSRCAAIRLYWNDDRAKRNVHLTANRSDDPWTSAKGHVRPWQRRGERPQGERQ